MKPVAETVETFAAVPVALAMPVPVAVPVAMPLLMFAGQRKDNSNDSISECDGKT